MCHKKKRQERISREIAEQPASPTDPNGSYTGKPQAEGEKPVQDADDLGRERSPKAACCSFFREFKKNTCKSGSGVISYHGE